MVYIHELFHAYFDSPHFDKIPDPKLEETMAQFGMLTLINKVFGKGSRLAFVAEVESSLFAGEDRAFEYYYGLALFNQTEEDERWGILRKYRFFSDYIDTSFKYSDFHKLYAECDRYNIRCIKKYINDILSLEYSWKTWYSHGQLPRFN